MTPNTVLVAFTERRLKRALEIAHRTDLTPPETRLARAAVCSFYRTLMALGAERRAHILIEWARVRAEMGKEAA